MTEAPARPTPVVSTAGPVRASAGETLQVAVKLVVPAVAAGLARRRPLAMALAERCQFDRSAIRLLQRLRSRHGGGPLCLRVPGRTVALLLSVGDVGRILTETPEPFTPDNLEKRAALAKFQPHGSLVSRGRAREQRRGFNEAVLQPHLPLHRLAEPMLAAIDDECVRLGDGIDRRGLLNWDDFERTWWRIVRRVVFGDTARSDQEVIGVLAALRRSANWSYLSPRRTRTREALAEHLRGHLERAEAGSLAEAIYEADLDPGVRPEDQVAHWLFAFDAAGTALMRTLALLAVHRGHRHVAKHELAAADPGRPAELPYLRACVLESLRLWPTTPLILRDGTADTAWGDTSLPTGTAFVVYTPLFHRDSQRLNYADRFSPDIWTDGTAELNPSLVPFSGGPARCPGRNLVLFCVTSALARLLRDHEFRLASATPLFTGRPVPATLDHFSLVFRPGGI